jgi:ATP-dependent protease ClpP protease subunit/regulator of replication initiation timing
MKFKNISQIDNQTCKILLYSEIGTDEGCIPAAYFVEVLDWAATQFKKCNVHVNSLGGDVFEGIAMYEALHKSSMDIKINIDGVAASMASVVSYSRGLPYMSKYARLMFHSVSGEAKGTIQQMESYIETAKSIQNTLIDILSERTGLPKDDVVKNWFDGSDHWLTASEALELKIISGIYDGAQVAIPDGEMSPSRLYNIFNNVLKPTAMKYTNFFKRFGLKDEATEDEVIEKVAGIEQKATTLEAENATLKTQNADLAQKLADKEAAEVIAHENEVKNLVDAAVNDGRIQDVQKAHFTAILKADKVNGLAILNALPKGKRIMDELTSKEVEARKAWTFKDWSKNDSKGLEAMKVNDKAQFTALYKAQYGKEPKI